MRLLFPQERLAVDEQARGSEHTQTRREGFTGLDGARNTAAREDDGGKQGKFDAVWLAFRDAVASKAILSRK